MDEWTKLTRDRIFISDIGNDRVAEIGGAKTLVGRYAVWAPAPGGEITGMSKSAVTVRC